MAGAADFITRDSLQKVVNNSNLVNQYYEPLVTEMSKASINTKNRVSSFLAEVLHESNNLSATKENLYYTAQQLLNTFPKYFKTLDQAKQYEKQPEKIANYVYGGRLGNTAAGDGYKYRGRGLMQTTGKDNYSALAKFSGIDFVNKPELLEQPKYAVLSAVYFWTKNGLNSLADKGDFKGITQKINGGQNGAADRQGKYEQLMSFVKDNPVKVGLGFFLWFQLLV